MNSAPLARGPDRVVDGHGDGAQGRICSPLVTQGDRAENVAVDLGELAAAAQLTGVWTEDCADRFSTTGRRMNDSLSGWAGTSGAAMEKITTRWEEVNRRLVEHVGSLSVGFQLAHYELSSADRESADQMERSTLLNLD